MRKIINMKKEETFVKPECEIIIFSHEDIIVTSPGVGGLDDEEIP